MTLSPSLRTTSVCMRPGPTAGESETWWWWWWGGGGIKRATEKELRKKIRDIPTAGSAFSSLASEKLASACTRAVTEMVWPWRKEEGDEVG